MIRIKDHKQQQLFDPWHFLSPKRRRMLEEDWPGLFREHLLQKLPVDQIAPHFTPGVGRPTKELHTVLGVLLLQQALDLSDQVAIEQLCFNIQWHYALNITEESDDAKYISEKTLYTMRQLMIEHHLDKLMFDAISEKLALVFDVDTQKQRIDSVHIHSNMRKLGRIRIFTQTIFKFLVNLKRHHRNLFDIMESKFIGRYWGNKAMAVFSLIKPSQSAKTLKQVSADLMALIEQLKDQPTVCSMHSYKLMQRVLSEQCTIESGADDSCEVVIKKPSDIASDSLQNPSDPDATYDGHKGQGYQVQVMETFSQSQDADAKQRRLNLITHVAVQRACESDAHAVIPAIADTQKRQLAADELLADTAYGSDDNHQAAKSVNVNLLAPVHKGNATNTSLLTGFAFNEKGYAATCPAGHCPERVGYKKKTDRFSAAFNKKICIECPLIGQCKLKEGKNHFFLHYSSKQCRLAVRRGAEQHESFAERYRWRAGVEATMSEFDRRTGVKHLRVRGMPAVRFCATMKATGLNLLRAGAVRKARRNAGRSSPGICDLIYATFTAVKERILMPFGDLGLFMFKITRFSESELYLAA